MAVNASLWRKNACEIIGAVADENFQRSAWFGKGRHVSSPEEVYNQIFDDLDIKQFIASPDVSLNDLQKTAATRLVDKMEYFDRLVGPNLPPDKVIDHPVWREIREAAQRVLDVLQCPSAPNT